jgi:hypothetical protein
MEPKEKRFTFYFPGLRLLSNAEIEALPQEKRKAAAAPGKPGVWLEVPCPGDACTQDQGKICIEAVSVGHKDDRGIWLKIFCPEDSCLFKGGTDLP